MPSTVQILKRLRALPEIDMPAGWKVVIQSAIDEIARQRDVINDMEDDRIRRLGGIGSPG